MKLTSAYSTSLIVVMSTFVLLVVTIKAAPMETNDEQALSELNDVDAGEPWDSINTAALKKLLLQLDTEDRFKNLEDNAGFFRTANELTVHLVLGDFRRPWTPDTLEEFQLKSRKSLLAADRLPWMGPAPLVRWTVGKTLAHR